MERTINKMVLSGLAAFSAFSFATAAPVIEVTPDTTDFGDVVVGGSSAEETIEIRNTGDSNLTISNIIPRGRDIDEFRVTSTTCNFNGTVLPPGGSCVINAVFEPTSVGLKKGLFKILSDATNAPIAYAYLRGTGVSPEAEISPGTINFGEVYIPGDSADYTVTVSNTGNSTLEIGNVVLRGINADSFRILSDGCANQTLNPGQSCNIVVDFKPQDVGYLKAVLKVYTNDVTEPKLYTKLRGIGRATNEPDIASDMDTYTFETYAEMEMPCDYAVITVSNEGGVNPTPLNIDTVAIRGRDAVDFNIDYETCSGSSLGAGETCEIGVSFCPGAPGFKKAVIKIISNDPDENPFYIKLRGNANGVIPQ